MVSSRCCVDSKQNVFYQPFCTFKRCHLYKAIISDGHIPRLYTAMNYCQLRSLFRMPVVHAETPSATDIIERRVEEQRKLPSAMISDAEIFSYISRQTGRERLHQMFSKEDDGTYSKELVLISQSTVRAAVVTLCVMSFFGARNAKEKHLAENKTTVYKTKFRALRSLNDTMFLGGMKEGARWAVKVTCFTFSYLLISQTIAVYRNKSSPLEYSISGALTGFVFKMNLGMRGGFVGSLVGGVMGLAAGVVIYGLMWLGDQTQEQRHFREVQSKLETYKELQISLGKTELFNEEITSPTAS